MIKYQKAGIVACSNPRPHSDEDKLNKLTKMLKEMGLRSSISNVYGGTGKERADALMKFYCDDEISDIFDISGGDIANEILPYLDYNLIGKTEKTFWGYSDLTTVINAIYTKTGSPSVLYQIRNLLHRDNLNQLFDFSYEFIQGNHMHGIVIGGNIRCLLKLAGTEYWPDMNGKILVLEAMSGMVPQMTTYLAQLKQLNVFEQIHGIILGTFTQMESEGGQPSIAELVLGFVKESLPVVKTNEIGHSIHSKAIIIGKELELTEEKQHVII